MSYLNKLRKNIVKNYVFIFFSRLDLTQGIWMIYLATKGMSLLQLGILEGVFHVTSLLMEVPTGVIADIYGRKTSRILGRFALLISIILLIYSNNFCLFAVSFIISALSYNLESGAGDALIYDSLKEIKEEERYMKINGNNEMFMQISSVVAYALGGYLAAKNYLIAFGLSAIFIIITFVESFYFQEPNIKSETVKERNPFKVMKNQVTTSIKVIKGNRNIVLLIVFSEVMAAFCTSLFFYLQNYWKGFGYTEFKIGIIYSVASIFAAITAVKVYDIERIIGQKGVLIIMPLANVLCIWGIALTNYEYVFYVLMSVIDTITYVTFSDYINKLIPSENRATILSFQSMVFSFIMILLFPMIGSIGDAFSLNVAFKALASIGSILLLMMVIFSPQGCRKWK
ncbi:major facilitator superfamily protein [Clostridium tepidiprofundi DSM 19306]|uniref:Major facilitator superfamily protein n=1 Tax=Clostridium tepidiprofundi DSM 19306 TaxID=1121338 RepID=A0A151B2A9_9CLOT|nr:MFS transporter [Clostridium tepidiprofundi]KYH34038.1 major facilitator superfamily protein [Clostridium tepidiprofundi DSM 19306]